MTVGAGLGSSWRVVGTFGGVRLGWSWIKVEIGLGWPWIVVGIVEGVGMTVGAGLGWAWINVGVVEDVGRGLAS